MERQPWLNEGEQHAWRSFMEMRQKLDSLLERQLTSEAGLSAADYALLVPLSEAPDRQMRSGELARQVGWEKSRLSHQISRMTDRGLLTRQGCPTDGRGTVIELTDKGMSAIQEAAPGHVGQVRRYFIDLLTTEQLAALAEISQTVLSHLGEAARQCASSSPSAVCGPDEAPDEAILI